LECLLKRTNNPLWLKKVTLLNQTQNQNTKYNVTTDASFAEDHGATLENSACAGFVSAIWPIKENFQE